MEISMVQRQTKEIEELLSYFRSNSISKVFVVCGKSALKLKVWDMLSKSLSEIQIFMDFSTNPLLSEAVNGINIFNKKVYDAIIAIGGGSSIDVAKYIIASNKDIDNLKLNKLLYYSQAIYMILLYQLQQVVGVNQQSI